MGDTLATMKITVYLEADAAERLEALADEQHRTVRQQATVLILQALGLIDTSQSERARAAA